ncbi:hypothetical protein D3C87_1875490 [compost metagenome]
MGAAHPLAALPVGLVGDGAGVDHVDVRALGEGHDGADLGEIGGELGRLGLVGPAAEGGEGEGRVAVHGARTAASCGAC